MNTPTTEEELLNQWKLLSLRVDNLEDEITTHRRTIREIQEKLIWMKWNLRVGSIVRAEVRGEVGEYKVTNIPYYHGSFNKPTICIHYEGQSIMLINSDYEVVIP